MVYEAIYGCRGGHGVFEYPVPLREHQVRGDQGAPPLVPLGQEGEDYRKLIPIVLYVPDVIDDDSIELIETAQFLFQSEIPLGCQQALDQAECRCEEDRMTLLKELMTDRAHQVCLSPSGKSEREDLFGTLGKMSFRKYR